MKSCALEFNVRRALAASWAGVVLAAVMLAAFGGNAPLQAQRAEGQTMATEANYQLAGRFAPYKVRELLYSTSVSPNWIEGSDRFWYEWKTSDGTTYYLVDPARGTKREVFDNDRIAAELTRITLDPWDGKHLPIRKIKFIDEELPAPSMAPTVGQHTESVMADVLGYDADKIAALRSAGAFGKK